MPSFPDPDYPRPRIVRDRWLSLNGEWEFAFDPENRGLAEGWADSPLEGRISVPYAHQWSKSGLDDKRLCEVVWYARDFELPADWDETTLLHFGAVDYEATVWVNGHEMGFHRGGHVPFAFDATLALRPGTNRVVVRALDRQEKTQPRGKQAANGKPHGIDYWCTTGIWQSVWLEPVPSAYLADLVVRPDLPNGALFIEPVIYGARGDVEVRAEIPGVARAAGGSFGEPLRLEIPDPRPWSPEDPFLYELNVSLWREGVRVDEVRSYAGMRSVEIKNGRFVLNGEPVVLRMVLDQGYWPESGLTAPSDDALRADVEWCKRLGFNGARKHQKVEDPRWLTWCDRLGLLVWGEMANARAYGHTMQERLEAEWSSAVERDRSHPCVIAWVPLNESMGFDKLEAGDPAQRHGVDRLVHLTRRLDPTRPVIDNDGWEQGAASDVVAIHDYSHSGRELAARYKGPLPIRIWSGSRISLLSGVEAAGRPILLTEVGGFLTRPAGPHEELDVMYRIYDSIANGQELEAKVVELLEALASLPFLAGYCYTQLTDVEQELNGLLTYDRQPKVDPEVIRRAVLRIDEESAVAG